MNSWKERKKKLSTSLDYDPLTTIPMIEGGSDNLTVMQARIRNEFDRLDCKRITIIDQYFLPSDIDFIIHTFASLHGRKIRILTKLADPKNVEQKQTHESNFKEAIKQVEKKGIFSEFKIYKANIPIHDRYFISEDLSTNSPCLSLGTSINMLFQSYSCIIKIENNSFKRQVLKLADLCIQSGNEIREWEDGR
ncbi:hypothetical protein [Rheinheimera sp. F8]|uniref:hypothetical protein n=1 Tax=Rheinheimera sp. F8 TaxID=1763998 RepID=UPI000744926F|nr:hypothetical protein [Rheinheimera sp. F8]ALZ75395.1 hypothetical protein ATY27_06265 [Rheinheimera sp. F8]ALZ75791.1 hypothetical protein ATY27_08440 [Rheinheimera sp. F8]